MEKITIGQAEKLTSPNPFAILTVKKPDGTTNAMAVSWWCYASNKPATVAVCLSQKGYSGTRILETGRFGLNIVGPSVKDAAYACGTCSGRDMNKAAEKGLPLADAEGFDQQMVEGSRIWFNCSLTGSIEAGDHRMYIGEVSEILADPEVPGMYAWNGYGYLNPAQEA